MDEQSSPKKKRTYRKWIVGIVIFTVSLGFLVPERGRIPVEDATSADWHPRSYWYHPWGVSGVHKGIDIFAERGRPVVSAVDGLILSIGSGGRGGNTIMLLGPRWRFHYYAHLDTVSTGGLRWVAAGETIGTVGDSGNARGKPPHLHYVIMTAIPYPWRVRIAPQGWKRMFYLNPEDIVL